MAAKGIGDAGLNGINIQMILNGMSDQMVPSSVISATTRTVGSGIDMVTGGQKNYAGKSEVVGDLVDFGISFLTGSTGTGINKAMNISKFFIDFANSVSKEW